MKYNKKGSIVDNFWAMLQLFGMALFLLIMYFVWTGLTGPDIDTKFWQDNPVSADAKADGQRAFDSLDLIYMIIYFGVHLGILALAYMLRNHPIMYVVVLLVTAVMVVVAAPLANVWEDVVQEADFATSVNALPRTDYIVKNLPLFEMIWAFVNGVVLLGVARLD